MKTGLGAGVEMIRIALLLLIAGGLLGGLVHLVYTSFGISMNDTSGAWLAGVSILIILFVFYRNKFQFTGFYTSDKNVKLKRGTSTVLLSISLLMLVLAPLLT